MGEIGWVLGIIGLTGVVVAIYRRNRTDMLLLALTAIYPIADALTYYDARANSIRGISGAVIWAIWVAVGALAVIQLRSKASSNTIATVALVALLLQSLLFIGYYFGPYTNQYAYAFETGYGGIYESLASRGLQNVPITLHAGYERDAMLQYFSQYRLHAPDTVLACSDLPFNVVHYTVLPRIFIVREDRDFGATPGCVQQSDLIQRDRGALLSVAPQAGEGPRIIDVIDAFANDPQGGYYTAIWYLHY
jgi:hypothetical protein